MVLPQAKQLSASQAPVIDLSPLGDGTIGGREVLARRIVEAARVGREGSGRQIPSRLSLPSRGHTPARASRLRFQLQPDSGTPSA